MPLRVHSCNKNFSFQAILMIASNEVQPVPTRCIRFTRISLGDDRCQPPVLFFC
ncbi:hypothetical protein GGP46_002941 [Salinibacter ruber]|nr:hypothetical protein [Salinibacter ruber]